MTVREVPALVCSQCGDAWFEDAVAAKLEAIMEEARLRRTTVEISQWRLVA